MAASNNPFFIEPANPLQALMTGVQGYDRGRASAKEAEIGAGRQEAMAALQSGADPSQALARLIGVGDIQGATVLAKLHETQNQHGGVYGTPIYGQLDNGQTGIGTFDRRGQFKQIQTPGFTPTLPVKTLDVGGGYQQIPSRSPVVNGNVVQRPPSTSPRGFAPPDNMEIPQSVVDRANAPQPGSGAPIQPTPVPTQSFNQPPGFIPKDILGPKRDAAIGTDIGEKIANMGKAQQARDTTVSNLDRLREAIVELKNAPGLPGNLAVQGVFPNWPGGQAADAAGLMDTIKSQVSGAVLQSMRDASKTGGAVGQVTEKEWPRLENMLSALASTRQSLPAYQKQLDAIIKFIDGSKGRINSAFDTDYGQLAKAYNRQQPQTQVIQPQSAQPLSIDDLVKKYQ